MIGEFRPAGFVLVGGKSLRMGESKAFLPYRGRALAQHIAELLVGVAHPVLLIGDPETYGLLGYETVPDAAPDRGPLSGIEAALGSAHAREWNLILACDMPLVRPDFLIQLSTQATLVAPEIDCVVPETNGKLQPLCAIYRRRCGPAATAALATGTRRVVDYVTMLQARIWPVQDWHQFRNVNTRPEWNKLLSQQTAGLAK